MIAYCYTVYDGLEFLELSIENHRPHVDFIVVCYQTVSNIGVPNDRLYEVISRLKNCICVEYFPDLKVSTKENERRKHNMMIETARRLGCSHFILSATDHFYSPEDMKRIPEYLSYDVTFTKMFTYYKYSDWQLTPIEEYFMPFVTKLHPITRIENITPRFYPAVVDPSVRINTYKHYTFSDIMMHHYSFVRENVREKLVNSASRFRSDVIQAYITEYNEYDISKNLGIKYFQGRKVKIVPVLKGLEIFKQP